MHRIVHRPVSLRLLQGASVYGRLDVLLHLLHLLLLLLQVVAICGSNHHVVLGRLCWRLQGGADLLLQLLRLLLWVVVPWGQGVAHENLLLLLRL